MKSYKNLPIYLLSFSLLFVGVSSGTQAEGASSNSQLEKRIKALEEKNQTLELTTKVLVKWVKELRGCYLPVTATVNQGVAVGGGSLASCIRE